MVRLMNQFMVSNLVKVGPSKFYAIKRGIQQITRILYDIFCTKEGVSKSIVSDYELVVQLSPVLSPIKKSNLSVQK